jgi:hypothetical protein
MPHWFSTPLNAVRFLGRPPCAPFSLAVKASPGIFTRRSGFLIDTGRPVAGYGFLLWTGTYRWFYFFHSVGRKNISPVQKMAVSSLARSPLPEKNRLV